MYLSKKNGGSAAENKKESGEVSFSPFVIGVSAEKKTNGNISTDVGGNAVREPRRDSVRPRRKRFPKRVRAEKSASVITEYAATRRVNIILFSVISLIGVFIGIICAKDLDADKLALLRDSTDAFYSDISTSAMIMKILNAVLYSAIYIVVIFLGGFTIFAPVVSAAAGLLKSVLFGFTTAALIFTASGKFDAGIAALCILFGVSQILTLALASGEALGFSVFLLKNEESYKKSLSFPNVSLYSLRHIIFLILLSSISVLETVIIPLMYDLLY